MAARPAEKGMVTRRSSSRVTGWTRPAPGGVVRAVAGGTVVAGTVLVGAGLVGAGVVGTELVAGRSMSTRSWRGDAATTSAVTASAPPAARPPITSSGRRGRQPAYTGERLGRRRARARDATAAGSGVASGPS